MMQDSVAVVIPAFNAQEFLARTVASARAQTHRNLEIWIVDDGSTDQTAALARQLARQDERVRVVSQSNGGQASARNAAIRATEAHWIAFLDADDLWEPDKLETQLRAARENGADAVFCGGVIFEQSPAEPLQDYPTLVGNWGGLEMARLLFARNPICNSSVVARRALIEEVGFLDEAREVRNAEDYDLWFRLALGGAKFCGIAGSLAHYRRHQSSSTAVYTEMHRPEIVVLERHWRNCGVTRAMAKKRLRSTYRALAGGLAAQQRFGEARQTLDQMGRKWDAFGPLSLFQRVLMRAAPRAFNPAMAVVYGLGEGIKRLESRVRPK